MFAWLVVAAAVAAALQFYGPYKGWFERVTGTEPPPPPEPVVEEAPVELPPPPETPALVMEDEKEPEPPPKTELEKKFDGLVAHYLTKLKKPQVGQKYKLRLRDRTTVEGRLVSVSPGRVALKVEYGTITYAVNQIDRRSVHQLFPERAAKWRALKELRREQEEAAAATAEPTGEAAAAGGPAAPAAPVARPFKYDPTPEPTPDRLKDTVADFGGWLQYQHRRVGGKIADKIYAKQQGANVVLYMIMNPLFTHQDYDFRFQLAEGLHKFWSFRCEGSRVCALPNAHLVLLDKSGKIIGGSTVKDSSDIWVPKTSGRPVARR